MSDPRLAASLEAASDDYLRSTALWAADMVRSEANGLGFFIDHRADFDRVPGRFAEMVRLTEEAMALWIESLVACRVEICRRALV